MERNRIDNLENTSSSGNRNSRWKLSVSWCGNVVTQTRLRPQSLTECACKCKLEVKLRGYIRVRACARARVRACEFCMMGMMFPCWAVS